jgi:hypothetical protein
MKLFYAKYTNYTASGGMDKRVPSLKEIFFKRVQMFCGIALDGLATSFSRHRRVYVLLQNSENGKNDTCCGLFLFLSIFHTSRTHSGIHSALLYTFLYI